MAKFKILKGLAENLPATKIQGQMYVTTDDPGIYVDVDSSTRIQVANVSQGEENVIEKIKKNRTELSIDSSDKSVNIEVPAITVTKKQGTSTSTIFKIEQKRPSGALVSLKGNLQIEDFSTGDNADKIIKIKGGDSLNSFTRDIPTQTGMQNYVTNAVSTKLNTDGSNAASDFDLSSSTFFVSTAGESKIESSAIFLKGDISINTSGEGTVTIKNVVTPTSSTDAANKGYVDTTIATELENFQHQDYEIVDTLPATGESGVRYLLKIIDDPGPPTEFHMEEYMYLEGQWRDCGRFDSIKEATDTVTGTVKLNPAESVTLNSNGQLVVGGRLGQYPNGGVFYPTTIAPSGVGTSSFLMSDGAKGLSITQRTFAIMAGANITCKSTAAGSTTYRVSNTQANRFACAAVVGGYAALNQTDAVENGTASIVSIKYANGNNLTIPTFGPNDNSNDIIITLSRSVNPSAATTAIRVYGKNANSDNILVGQGVGAGGGKAISLGQSTYAGGNQNIAFGNSTYVTGNNSVAFGHTMYINKQYCLGAGQGHDFTNAVNGTTAVGTWSILSNTTKFAVGDGTAFDARSNILEVRSNSGATEMIMKSPNGTRYKVTVDNNGTLSATAV